MTQEYLSVIEQKRLPHLLLLTTERGAGALKLQRFQCLVQSGPRSNRIRTKFFERPCITL